MFLCGLEIDTSELIEIGALSAFMVLMGLLRVAILA